MVEDLGRQWLLTSNFPHKNFIDEAEEMVSSLLCLNVSPLDSGPLSLDSPHSGHDGSMVSAQQIMSHGTISGQGQGVNCLV